MIVTHTYKNSIVLCHQEFFTCSVHIYIFINISDQSKVIGASPSNHMAISLCLLMCCFHLAHWPSLQATPLARLDVRKWAQGLAFRSKSGTGRWWPLWVNGCVLSWSLAVLWKVVAFQGIVWGGAEFWVFRSEEEEQHLVKILVKFYVH